MANEGAGFILFKHNTVGSASPLMLALIQDDGVFDIPKGRIDGGESPIEAAKRECFEECSIVIGTESILFGGSEHVNGRLTLFSASTDGTPSITINPHSGIIEHAGHKWVTKDEFLSNCLPYLKPGANHFYSILEKTYNP